MYYLMIQRRDDWGILSTYRYGKAIKDMKVAMSRCRKTLDSFVINDKNICICINNRGSTDNSTFSSLSTV